MAGSKSKSNTAASGRVQKKMPTKPITKSSTIGSTSEPYTGNAKGVTQLPAARIKRIIKEDKDVQMVSNDAVFVISIATELFLESFTAKAFNLAKLEKRKTVHYKDLAKAVTQHDSLEFLQDVVPKTMPLVAALEKQRVAKEMEESGTIEEEEEEEEDNDDVEEEEQGEQEDDGSAEDDSDEETNGHNQSEEADSSQPMSDDEELSAPEDMDED
ncbi:hypothetical protein EDD11_007747 [Mortierella claussenii]|nr:hypothetical protein EDD11_007747 [Mortierella claussenii]